MDPDEIGLVLVRVSQLHEKFSDTIDRLSDSDSAVGWTRSRNFRKDHDSKNGPTSPTSDDDRSTEARSLMAIRDALEFVEHKLKLLQSLQQQQSKEKNAVRVELEKSRRTLLKRLKEHRGNEWQVVQEALTFVGGSTEDTEELPLPPYPAPLATDTDEQSAPPRDNRACRKFEGTVKELSLGMTSDEEEEDFTDESQGGTASEHHTSRKIGGNLGTPAGFLKALFTHAFGVTTKAAVVLVSLAAAMAVLDSKQKKRGDGNTSMNIFAAEKSPPAISGPPLLTVRQVAPSAWCPPGTNFILENGFAKCVKREPRNGSYPQELGVPDVLYGRG